MVYFCVNDIVKKISGATGTTSDLKLKKFGKHVFLPSSTAGWLEMELATSFVWITG